MHEWDHAHATLTEHLDYGGPHSYERIATFLTDCSMVEDWGCGGGKMREYITTQYRGIDGSESPFADMVADLTTYRSECDAVILRHVLEHNYAWRDILANAIFTAHRKVAVVLFTPMQDTETHNLWSVHDYGDVPNIAFVLSDLLGVFGDGWAVEVDTFDSPNTYFGTETCLFATRDR